MNTPFAYGEKVLLLDLKQRRYLITLAEGAEFHSHNGFFAHSDLVGQLEGIVVKSRGKLLVISPRKLSMQ